MIFDIKQLAKRSRMLHSAVKLTKMLPDAAGSMTRDIRRTADIYRVLPNTMLRMSALVNLYECARTLEREGIAGDFAECGVWAGGAVGLMAIVNRRYGTHPRTLHLFDSFEGLPQPTTEDGAIFQGYRSQHPNLVEDDGKHPDRLMAIGACATTAYGGNLLDNTTDLLENVLNLASSNYVVHKGWFQHTVPVASSQINNLALLRLDGDWYESTKTCLEGLYDKMVPGGYLILDDYVFFSGCTQAVDEFLECRSISRDCLTVEPWGAFLRIPRLNI